MNILITDKTKTPESALNLLQEQGFSLTFATSPDLHNEPLEHINVLLIRYTTKITKELLNNTPNLNAIITCSAGLDHIDLNACKERNIKIYNSPGSNATAVAEHTIALLFAVLRKVVHADKHLRTGQWKRETFIAHELEGKTIAILGYGAIGKLIAHKLNGFHPQINVYDPYLTKEQVNNNTLHTTKVDTVEEAITNADIITIHMPLTEETTHLISTKELDMMKPTTIILNTSRGEIIDEDALLNVLHEQKIYGAGLDVFANEPAINEKFKQLENVVLTPHIASLTHTARKDIALVAVNNFINDTK